MASLFRDPLFLAPNPCRLLIIAPDNFLGILQPLIDHKNATGMPSFAISLEEIVGKNTDKLNHPLKIKKLIAKAHEQHGTWYVMLAGDASLIPVKHRYVKQTDGGLSVGYDGTYNPSDNYYANLYRPGGDNNVFSDWDDNKDGKFNEQDWGLSPDSVNPDNVDGYPHISVGRIPAHNETEMNIYTQKIINYEKGLFNPLENSFSFIADLKLPGLASCNSVWYDSQISSLKDSSIKFFEANTVNNVTKPPYSIFNSKWHYMQAFTSKWVVHFGHGYPNGWGIDNMNDHYISTETEDWCISKSNYFPIILSGGCETGLFMPNAPNGIYRGLNPDVAHHFWTIKNDPPFKSFVVDCGENDTPVGNETYLQWPVTLPLPNPYDFESESLSYAKGRTFAHPWLCNSAEGGAIAYVGSSLVHQGGEFEPVLFSKMLLYANTMNVLGDIWAQACRDYFSKNLFPNQDLGSVRIFLSYMHLFGDPSLRLRQVV